MNRLFVPTLGPTDWRRLLAKPATQWRRHKSALEMAVCWEAARRSPRGLPPEVAQALDSADDLHGAELLLGVPEHQVPFMGGRHPSQNDLWALLQANGALVSMTIEAKAGEKLDDLVGAWLLKVEKGSKKSVRLADLRKWLGIIDVDVSAIRYQLLHRTASAVKEAKRFSATRAVMLVQSFNRAADEESWQDFVRFGELMGVSVRESAVVRSPRPTGVPLFIGWVSSNPADLGRFEAAV